MATKRGKSKAKPKRPKRIGAAIPHIDPRRTYVRAFEAFHGEEDADKASELLQQIESCGYMSTEALQLYAEVLHETDAFDKCVCIAEQLLERKPNDPIAIFNAASSCLLTSQLISALLYYERFLELAPEHPVAKPAAESLGDLKQNLPKILESFGDDLPKDLPRLASFEKILHRFKLGRFEEVIQRAELHLKSYPADLKIRNNLAEALAHKGDGMRAMEVVNATVEMAPKNFFARALRCHLAFFQGLMEESRADAEMLLTLEPRQVSDLTKAAQVFAYRGEDDKVRWAYSEAERRDWLDNWPSDSALLHNFMGTCLARTGDKKSAKQHWERSVKVAGDVTTAQANLDDLKKPVGEQAGPAYFNLRDYFSPRQLNEMHEFADASQSPQQSIRQFLSKYPTIERLIPSMLDQCDGDSQELVIVLARYSKRAEVQAALQNYVRGSRGTDDMRCQALYKLNDEGQITESPVSIYIKGAVQQIELLRFEITDEPSDVPKHRTAESSRLIEQALDALYERDGAVAERLLRRVLQVEADQPDVLNNLALAIELQGRYDEAQAIVTEIVAKFPDYFFGKIALANRLNKLGRHDEALEILFPLQRQTRYHTTQLFGLVAATVYAYAGKGEHENARYWLSMLKQYVPDHPGLPGLEELLTQLQPVSLIRKLFSRGSRK